MKANTKSRPCVGLARIIILPRYALAAFGLMGAIPAAAQEPGIYADLAVQAKWVPLVDNSAGLLVIPIRLNGETVNALIDTGAQYLTVDRAWAVARDLSISERGLTPTLSSGSLPTGVAPLKDVMIGGSGQRGGGIAVMDLGRLKSMTGAPFDAVIGSAFLANHAVQINFDNRRVRFLESGSAAPDGISVPIAIDARAHRIATSLSVSGRELQPIIIDTGDNASLAVVAEARSAIVGAAQRETDIMAVGADGRPIVSPYLRLTGVRWGTAELPPTPTQLNTRPLSSGDAGRIGVQILRRFNIHMDARAGTMVLSPRRSAEPAPSITRAGVQGPTTDAGQQVVHVMKGSPALRAGIRSGDRICAVNGKRLVASDGDGSRPAWGKGPTGTRIRVDFCDGRSTHLTLAEFY